MALITTYRAKRRIKVGPQQWLGPGEDGKPGDLVPQMHLGRIVGGSRFAGFVDEVQVEVGEFVQAVKDNMSERDEQIAVLEKVGLSPDALNAYDEEPAERQVKHPRQTVEPDPVDEHRVPGPTGDNPPPPPVKRVAKKQPGKKAAPEAPEEKLIQKRAPGTSPKIPQRTIEE